MATFRALGKRLAFLADELTSPMAGVVLLAYHRVGGRTDSPVDLPLDDFERQMEHLAEAHCVLTIDDALDELSSNARDVHDTIHLDDTEAHGRVVLTFDDGTADFVELALPVLVDLDLPAVLYVATAHIDDSTRFPGGALPLSWNALRECVATGLVTIGSHTHTHALLDRVDPMSVDLELDVSNERIAAETDVDPEHFAYPKALAGSRYADGAVRLRYRSAAIAGTRPNVRGATDPWMLHRSPVQTADGWEGFIRKVRGGMRAEDDVRRLVNIVRHRGTVT